MRTQDFNFDLPTGSIAQHPADQRDASRLFVFHRESGRQEHRRFTELVDYLKAGDVLVMNNSRVIPARLRGVKKGTQGQFEILLLEENSHMDWWVMLRPGKRVRPGTELQFQTPSGKVSNLVATVLDKNDQGWCRLRFAGVENLLTVLPTLGEMPLPPYIHRKGEKQNTEDAARYQTVFAQKDGSVAAPTAGLHFTPELLSRLQRKGVELHEITLHVGYGTFAPLKVDKIEDHSMHEERYEVPEITADAVNQAKSEGRRVVAVGTTTVRVLETVARANGGRMLPGWGKTRIFIYPPSQFLVVDALVTNFHLPESTLLMLVSAFAAPGLHPEGRDRIMSCYQTAISQGYRFFSYGDAMLLL